MLFETTNSLLREIPSQALLYPGHDYVKKNLEFALHCEPDNKLIKERLFAIANETVERRRVFSLEEELAVNPFLRLNESSVQENLGLQEKQDESLIQRKLFHKLRSLRDKW